MNRNTAKTVFEQYVSYRQMLIQYYIDFIGDPPENWSFYFNNNYLSEVTLTTADASHQTDLTEAEEQKLNQFKSDTLELATQLHAHVLPRTKDEQESSPIGLLQKWWGTPTEQANQKEEDITVKIQRITNELGQHQVNRLWDFYHNLQRTLDPFPVVPSKVLELLNQFVDQLKDVKQQQYSLSPEIRFDLNCSSQDLYIALRCSMDQPDEIRELMNPSNDINLLKIPHIQVSRLATTYLKGRSQRYIQFLKNHPIQEQTIKYALNEWSTHPNQQQSANFFHQAFTTYIQQNVFISTEAIKQYPDQGDDELSTLNARIQWTTEHLGPCILTYLEQNYPIWNPTFLSIRTNLIQQINHGILYTNSDSPLKKIIARTQLTQDSQISIEEKINRMMREKTDHPIISFETLCLLTSDHTKHIALALIATATLALGLSWLAILPLSIALTITLPTATTGSTLLFGYAWSKYEFFDGRPPTPAPKLDSDIQPNPMRA